MEDAKGRAREKNGSKSTQANNPSKNEMQSKRNAFKPCPLEARSCEGNAATPTSPPGAPKKTLGTKEKTEWEKPSAETKNTP